MKFRAKPIVVEAVQFAGNFEEIERFCGGDAEWRNGKLLVATTEGPLTANPGDWIIRGGPAEFMTCTPDVFARTYEPLEEL